MAQYPLVTAGAPVGLYPHEFPFTGKIKKVDIEVAPMLNALPPDKRDALLGESMGHAAMASQ